MGSSATMGDIEDGNGGRAHPVKDAGDWLPVDSRNTDVRTLPANVEPARTDVDAPQTHGFLTETSARRRLFLRFELLIAPWRDSSAHAFSVERDRGTAFLWAPVCFGLGSIIYFTLPREPLSGAFAVLTLLLAAIAWRIGRKRAVWTVLVGLALVAAGATAGQLRTQLVGTEMMSRTVSAQITGVVEKVEVRSNGRIRYTIDTSQGVGKTEFRGSGRRPDRVRLTARAGATAANVGDIISGMARLGPPPGSAFPGAYDFSFRSWFSGIGASGFFLGKPSVAEREPSSVLVSLTLSHIRSNISSIIRETLPERGGALAAALIVGDRSGIDEETAEALRRSGLAHILAISGLHMALVSATVIVAMRFFFALFPDVSLRYPVRKWAAGCALAAATGYLLLSGASVSTRRAFIMIAIMLLAVLIDRRALTMRNVALAALVVLVLAPESILTPGFQMSFAAVAALVATYSALTDRTRRLAKQPSANAAVRMGAKVGRNVGGLALTSLVAGLATGLFAAYHFHRVAPFGLLANMLAMPLVSVLVMPMALLSMLAMPFGLESVPLQLMDRAIAPVIATAEWVADLKPAGNTGYVAPVAMAFGAMSLLCATLLKSGLRLVAIPLATVSAAGLSTTWKPDVLILETGRQIAVSGDAGQLHLLRPKAEKFSTGIWKRAFWPELLDGANEPVDGEKIAVRGQGFVCDRFGCSITAKGLVVTHLTNTAVLAEDCRIADVIVVPYAMPSLCSFLPPDERPLAIDRMALERHGAYAISIATQSSETGSEDINLTPRLRVTTSYANESRPWTRHRIPQKNR